MRFASIPLLIARLIYEQLGVVINNRNDCNSCIWWAAGAMLLVICETVTLMQRIGLLMPWFQVQLEIRSVERGIRPTAESIMTDSVIFSNAHVWSCLISTSGLKSDGRNGPEGQPVSSCKMSCRSVKPLLRYGDFQDGGRGQDAKALQLMTGFNTRAQQWLRWATVATIDTGRQDGGRCARFALSRNPV